MPGTKYCSTKACVSSSPAGGLPCNPVRGASRAVSATAWDDSAQATGGPSTGSAARFACCAARLPAVTVVRRLSTGAGPIRSVSLQTKCDELMASRRRARSAHRQRAGHAVCGMQQTGMQRTTQAADVFLNMQPTTCNRQHATDNMQPTTCNRQQTTDSAHYAPWG